MKKLFILLIIFFSLSVKADENILSQNKRDLAKIESYLNNIKYFSSQFLQDSQSSGEMAEGKFYLLRPGRMRLEYNHPNKLLLITNKGVTTYYDIELDEISNIRTKSTPIHFLMKEKFDFANEDIKITDFQKNSEELRLSLIERDNKEQGSLTFVFQDNPIQLKSITLTNELNQVITAHFFNVKINKRLSKKLFKFQNPRIFKTM